MQTQVAHERKSILQLSMLSLPGNRLLPENYDKAKTTKKYLQTNLYSKNCNFSAQNRKKNDFHACSKPSSRFSMLESLFIGVHSQNIAWVCVQNFENVRF